MVHTLAIEILWIFTVQRNVMGSPASVTVTAQPSHHQCTVFPQRVFGAHISLGPYSSLYLCAPRPSISLILDLMALPPSLTSPSPTQASLAALMLSIAELIMRRHNGLAFFRFPFVNSRFLIGFFFPDDALNQPSSSPPPHPRRHVLVAVIAVSTTGHHSSSSFKHHPSP